MSYRYREKVTLSPVINILYLVMLGFVVWTLVQTAHDTRGLLVMLSVFLLLVAIPTVFGRLVIEVDEEYFRARWGFIGWPQKAIPLSNIYKSEVISYKPIRQFGGWGIRCGRIDDQMTAAYTLRGDRGVRLSLTEEIKANFIKTRSFLIGSMEPERLQQAIGR
jgi:hypothetical protein